MEWILNLLKAYPVMGIIFFGSLIGTILAYYDTDYRFAA
jgi:hypothetical protein